MKNAKWKIIRFLFVGGCLPLAFNSPAIANDSTATQNIAGEFTATPSNPQSDSANAAPPAADTSSADTLKIKSGLHFFVSVGAQFLNFADRSKFQAKLDSQFAKLEDDYTSDAIGKIPPQKQDFQKVNLAFPITAGVFWQFSDFHSLALGAGFLYDKESVVISDKFGETSNPHYTLQAFPVFAEYRLQISPDLISLKNGDYFSVLFRYYWMLPHTEIYSSWGKAEAKFEPLGNGYGLSLSYRFWNWNELSVWGELGLSSISVDSDDELFGEKPSWNLGGISVLIRTMF